MTSAFTRITSYLFFFIRLRVARGLPFKERVQHDHVETLTVTCKIDRKVTGESRVVLQISGQLAGDDVNTLRALLEQEKAAQTLDLKNVRLVDDDTVKLLAALEETGVRIENCPLYIREWITRERGAN